MKIGVLFRGQALYSTVRLVQAAEQRGHEARVIEYLRCFIGVAGAIIDFVKQGARPARADAHV